jgi:hypothetical protein
MAQHIYERAPSARSRGASIGDATELIIGKLLAKEPELRFQSAAELIRALDESRGILGRAATRDAAPDADNHRATPATRRDLVSQGSMAEARMTLGVTSGETRSAIRGRVTTARRKPFGWRAALLIATVALIVGAILAASSAKRAAGRAGTSEPPRSMSMPMATSTAKVGSNLAAIEPESVRVEIATTPSGAEVYRMPDAVRVGTTPYEHVAMPLDGELVFVIKSAGYRDETLAVRADESARREIVLQGLPRRPERKRTRASKSDRPGMAMPQAKNQGRLPSLDSPEFDRKSRTLNPFDE